MKKIGIICLAGKDAGGVFQYTQSLVEALEHDPKHKYVIFHPPNRYSFEESKLEKREISEPSPNFLQLGALVLQGILGIRNPVVSIPKKELEQFQDIDLFISPLLGLFPHFYLDMPYVLTIHDYQERYFPNFFSWEERLKRFLMKRIATKNATAILCETEQVKRDVEKFSKVDSNRIFVIPSPPPRIKDFNSISVPERQQLQRKYSLPSEYLIYPAQFWPHKNHLNLFKAFSLISKTHSDLYLVLTGDKRQISKSQLDLIKTLGLEKKIIILGLLDYLDLLAIFSLAKCLVMPSLFESLSIPIWEAFQLGVPVCASNITAIPEQVGDAGLLFDANNFEEMANKINQILSDKNLSNTLAIRGKARIEDLMARPYSSLLSDLVAACLAKAREPF